MRYVEKEKGGRFSLGRGRLEKGENDVEERILKCVGACVQKMGMKRRKRRNRESYQKHWSRCILGDLKSRIPVFFDKVPASDDFCLMPLIAQ